MIKTGSEHLDRFLEGYANLTSIYGEAGTGKTTMCLLAAIEQILDKKKIIFIDTEKNFSTERLSQLLGEKNKQCIKEMLVLKANNFNVQHTQIKTLQDIKNVSLIIVDSITHHYRRLYSREPELAKGMLAKQLSVLKIIAGKGIHVIATSQVYSDMKNNVHPLGRNILNRYSEKIIKLEKNPGKIIIEKPDNKIINFEIVNDGIKIL